MQKEKKKFHLYALTCISRSSCSANSRSRRSCSLSPLIDCNALAADDNAAATAVLVVDDDDDDDDGAVGVTNDGGVDDDNDEGVDDDNDEGVDDDDGIADVVSCERCR